MRVQGVRATAAAVVMVMVWSVLAASTAGAADDPTPTEGTVQPTEAPTEPAETVEPPAQDDVVDPPPQDEPTPPTLGQPAYTGYLTQPLTVDGTVGTVPEGARAVLQVRAGETWDSAVDPLTADPATGAFTATIDVERSGSIRVAVLGADDTELAVSQPATVTARRIPTTLSLTMPSSARDYSRITLQATWRAKVGPHPGGNVQVQFKPRGTTTYKWYATMHFTDGVGSLSIKPRNDGWYRLHIRPVQSFDTATSGSRFFDNRPPGTAVAWPSGAPRPSITLAPQSRHSRVAADGTISRISDAVWRSMKGRSWHSGCPVGRSSLRVVRVSYWAFDGYVRRGELVVHERAASRTRAIFTDLFERRTPIRSIHRVDRFGWSSKLKGADDYRSMKADNTSAFNCRQIVGRTSQRSPHAWGRSIDINPWENPYRSGAGWTPNKSWANRSTPSSITWRGSDDPVVRVFRKHGFRWLGRADYHHFED